MKKDVQATEARHFICPKSYVAKDGREVLFKEDWELRKGELRERSGGRCEYMFFVGDEHNAYSTKYERCTEEAVIPSHVIPRYPKRDDRLTNLMHQCFEHDRLTEKQSWRRIRSDRKEHRSARAQEA